MKDTPKNARAGAHAVAATLAAVAGELDALPDHRGARVHVLFAHLYRYTTARWLGALDGAVEAELAYRVIGRFYDLYVSGVLACRDAPIAEVPKPWRKYHRVARRLTLSSPIFLHLILVSLAARAHIRHDLGPAIHAAVSGLPEGPDRARQVEALLRSRASGEAFIAAARDFIAHFADHPSRWRRIWLRLYDRGIVGLRPIWLSTLQGWRQRSYAETTKNIEPDQSGVAPYG